MALAGSLRRGAPAQLWRLGEARRGFLGFLGSSAPSAPPMTEPLADVPAPVPAALEAAAPGTQVTTLASGVRIASEATWGPTATLGAYVDAGSIYETDANAGVSHLLEQMAFKGSANRSFFRIVREIEAMGGNVLASASREQMAYNIDCVRSSVPEALELLLDCVVNPKFTAWDLAAQKKKIKSELLQISEQPGTVLLEGMHYAAYQGGLGRPLLLSPEGLARLTTDDLDAFVAENYSGPRLVVAGSGVEHSELVSLAQDMLSGVPAGPPPPSMPSKYLGGDFRQFAAGPQTTVMLGFEFAGGWKDVKGSVAVTVLQYLLGGGASFSSGGPGKGMHSRLYTRVLNNCPWIHNCMAISSLYADTGIVGISVSGDSGRAEEMTTLMVKELQALASDVPAEQLERAKRAAVSMVLMNLESKAVVCEDIGRQVLTYGHRKDVAQFISDIKAVTPADIQGLLGKLMKTPVTLASHGNIAAVPRYDAVSKMF
eukprot:jgi/Tetstr1/428114/TSEL_018169.t1